MIKPMATRVCCKCKIEQPVKDFINESFKCRKCVAEERIERSTYIKQFDGVKPKKRKGYKLTELDKIAIKCSELGISYGEYQQRERQGRL